MFLVVQEATFVLFLTSSPFAKQHSHNNFEGSKNMVLR